MFSKFKNKLPLKRGEATPVPESLFRRHMPIIIVGGVSRVNNGLTGHEPFERVHPSTGAELIYEYLADTAAGWVGVGACSLLAAGRLN